jgi:hypothetical protein
MTPYAAQPRSWISPLTMDPTRPPFPFSGQAGRWNPGTYSQTARMGIVAVR